MSDEEIDYEEEEEEEEDDGFEEELQRQAQEAREKALKIAAEKKKRIEEERSKQDEKNRKRQTFLGEQSEFSSTFETRTAEEERKQKLAKEKNEQLLTSQMQQMSGVYVAPKSSSVLTEEAEESLAYPALETVLPPTPPVETQVEISTKKQAMLEEDEVDKFGRTLIRGAKTKKPTTNYDNLLTEPVTGLDKPEAGALIPELTPELKPVMTTKNAAMKNEGGDLFGDESDDSLRAPARIAAMQAAPAPVVAPAPAAVVAPAPAAVVAPAPAAVVAPEPNVPVVVKRSPSPPAPAPAATISRPTPVPAAAPLRGPGSRNALPQQTAQSVKNTVEDTGEDDEEQSEQDRKLWMAKQSDLTKRREDFHGAVAYTHGGMFSWQMYGTTDNTDADGSLYTEYLMRCQWGTTWDNMQPWIAARRFKEFSVLDGQLKEFFGQYKASFLPLPQKTILSAMSADLVKSRQAALELYMVRIVETMPEVLTSQFLDVFLNMRNRIAAIKKSIARNEKKELEVAIRNGDVELDADGLPVGRMSLGANSKAPAPGGLASMSEFGGKEPESKENGGQYYEKYSWAVAQRMKAIDIGSMSAEVAEMIVKRYESGEMDEMEAEYAHQDRRNINALTEDQVCDLEEAVGVMRSLLRGLTQKNMKQSKKPLEASLRICCYFWPNLKTTSNFSGDVDFALIPRAMQVEEDIGRCLNEYKNVASVLRAFNANNASAHTSAQHDDTPLSVPSFDAALARGKGKKSKAERATATTSSSSGGVTL